jgi:hypothetical protein
MGVNIIRQPSFPSFLFFCYFLIVTMAAAEYFAHGARPSAPYLAPQQPQRASSNPNVNTRPGPPQFSYTPPTPSFQPHPVLPHYQPPPYSHATSYGDESKPGVHFGPPLAELSGRHSFSSSRPSPQQWNQPLPPPPPQPARPNIYTPQAYSYNHFPQMTHQRPFEAPVHGDAYYMSGYASDPEPNRRRHKHQEKRKRRISDSSRSANADGFIGAAGGGLIGDLIFPGLGTAAGALAGWIGGKDYGENRKRREEKRERHQNDWERKRGSRNHSRDGQDRSRDHSSDGRRRSYDQR